MQSYDETVLEFGTRLKDLARTAFPGNSASEQATRDSILKDTLAAGVKREEIGVQLLRLHDSMSFSELYAEALALESSYEALSNIRRGQQPAVTAL